MAKGGIVGKRWKFAVEPKGWKSPLLGFTQPTVPPVVLRAAGSGENPKGPLRFAAGPFLISKGHPE